jgi:5-methylcytosine-specific restriction protein A
MIRKLDEPLEIFAVGENYTAKGLYLLNGHVKIYKGSLMSPITTASTRGYVANLRKILEDTIVRNYYFNEDYIFDNQSLAASVISGTMRNGNVFFKTVDGILLSEYMEVTPNRIEDSPKLRSLVDEDDLDGIITSMSLNPQKIISIEYNPKPLEGYVNTTITNTYKRNHNAVEVALNLSNFKCEIDPNHSTFYTNKGIQYLEGHHLIPLSVQKEFENSLDIPANIVGLCPNCHRHLHYGIGINPILKELFEKKVFNLKKSGINIDFEELLKYYS